MALIQTANGSLYTLSLTVLVAAIYLALVRLMDLNEKEPLWAVALMFALGATSGLALGIVTVAERAVASLLSTYQVAVTATVVETGKFVAFAVGVALLAAVTRWRGWSEINGLMDGIVYGSALGFGFATGEAFIREISFGGAFGDAFRSVGPLAELWSTALVGLSHGLFGAMIGAGFGAAVGARHLIQRIAYPVAGLFTAILVHVAYTVLARGNALGGTEAIVRTWVALLIPLAFVVAVIVVAQARERRTIGEELSGERESGAVTEEELAVLRSPAVRRSMYAKAFMRGDFDGWLAMRELHNRQVQLAFARRRLSEETDEPARQDRLRSEVERLRAAVIELKQATRVAPDAAGTGRAGA
jgi:RsiW-degrading membrane proteinase PrsW (M82 family)